MAGVETRASKKRRLQKDPQLEGISANATFSTGVNLTESSRRSSVTTPTSDTSSSHSATQDKCAENVIPSHGSLCGQLATVFTPPSRQSRAGTAADSSCVNVQEEECSTDKACIPCSTLPIKDQSLNLSAENKALKTKAGSSSTPLFQHDALRILSGLPGFNEDCCQECSIFPSGSGISSTIHLDSYGLPQSSPWLAWETLPDTCSNSSEYPTMSEASSNSLDDEATISPSTLPSSTVQSISERNIAGSNDAAQTTLIESTCTTIEPPQLTEQEEGEPLACRPLKSQYLLRELGSRRYGAGCEAADTNESFQKKIEKALYQDNNQDVALINKLPTEVLCMIFSYIPEFDLAKRCAPVCRNWYMVTKNPVLWRKLTFSGHQIPFDVVNQLLKQAPRLKSVIIHNRTDVDLILPVLHEYCRHLEYVELKECRPCNSKNDLLSVKYLHPFIRNGQRLSSLNIEGTLFRGSKFFKDLARLPKLQSLNVSCSRAMSPTHIIENIAFYPHLRSLKFKWFPPSESEYFGTFSSKFWRKKAEILKAYTLLFENIGTRLTSLEFDVGPLKDEDLQLLANGKNLKKLVLYHATSMGDIGMTAVGSLSNLEHLLIHSSLVLSPQVVATTFNTGKLTNLKAIHFVNCSLRRTSTHDADDGVEAIAKSCPQLRHFTVANCPSITDSGVRALLKHCPNLVTLDLYGTISVLGSCFLDIPSLTPHLQELIIEEQSISSKAEYMAILAKMFPSVEIKSKLITF